MNFFVTGTDTGVGKTLVCCSLLHAFAARDKKVAGMKPVAAGCEENEVNDDVKELRKATNILASLGQINPYSFLHPVAPHIAARNSGVQINLERILESFNELASQADVVIVEGAGGILVPLNEKQDIVDLVEMLDIPVIVVVGMRLGCLNHALLTQLAIYSRGLKFAGWIANILEPEMSALDENILSLQQRISAPLLGIIQYQSPADPRLIANQINLDLLEAEQ